MNRSQKYFDPETLARIRPFGIRARTLIEGLVAGLHRSPLRGHSIEFAQHREYVPGDDLRQVDWKVYARSDKHYLKQYEDETNLLAYLVLDTSQSMRYRGESSPLDKLEYAQLVACSLAYLVIAQQDSAGLVTFSGDIEQWLPPSSNPTQLEDIIRTLEQGSSQPRTDLAAVLEETVRRIPKPGLVILISDLLDDPERVHNALKLMRSAGHDLLLLQVLDSDELRFPFEQMSQFDGLEEAGLVVTDPLMIGGAYRRAMQGFCQQLAATCRQLGADYFLLQTDQSLVTTLPRVLASRLARRM